MTVTFVGTTTGSLSCVTAARRVTVASPDDPLPAGAVIEIDPPVALEPELVRVNVYVPWTGLVEVAEGSTLWIVGRSAFTTDSKVPVSL